MSNRIWTIRELEKGFTLEIQTEVPGQRGVVSQFIERHAVERLHYALNRIKFDYDESVKESKRE